MNTIEQSTFFLVVYLMLPITSGQRRRKEELQRFLFCGFVEPSELKNAIKAQNPNMTPDTESIVMQDLGRLDSFLGATASEYTRSIVSNMVQVVDYNDYALMKGRWRLTKARDQDQLPEFERNPSFVSVLIESVESLQVSR